MAKSQEVIGDYWGMLRLQLCIDERRNISEEITKIELFLSCPQAMILPLKCSIIIETLKKKVLPVSRLNIDLNRTTQSVPASGLLCHGVQDNAKQTNI